MSTPGKRLRLRDRFDPEEWAGLVLFAKIFMAGVFAGAVCAVVALRLAGAI